jgi:hypothetical protein
MRLLRPASEDDMVAVFLAAEVTSERYGPQIKQILARLGQPRGIVEQPDTRDEAANAARRQVRAAYRDYPSGDVFTGMPADVTWHHAALTPAELATVRYIDYPYWTEFSGGTRLAADGARRLGAWQDMAPGTIYWQIAENPRYGKLPPPVILLGEPRPAPAGSGPSATASPRRGTAHTPRTRPRTDRPGAAPSPAPVHPENEAGRAARPDRARPGTPGACASPRPQRNPGHAPRTTHFPSACTHPAAGDRPAPRFLSGPRRTAGLFQPAAAGSRPAPLQQRAAHRHARGGRLK